jgi:hypothetical protein
MENFTHVSPRTGVTYTVVPQLQRRMAGGILEGCEMYEKEYVQYDITLDGKRVQFAFELDKIDEQLRCYEEPGWHGVYSSGWD